MKKLFQNKLLKKIGVGIVTASVLATSMLGLTACNDDSINEIKNDVAGIEDIKNGMLDLSSTEDIEALKTLIAGLSTDEDIETIKALIAELATADQLAALEEELFPEEEVKLIADNYADESYEKFLYIDKVLKNRDCLQGDKFKLAQKWIIFNLMEAGYKEGVDIV